MGNTKAFKPCPFCGGIPSILISDDEGNIRNSAYEDDPWSGLSFKIKHTHEDNKNCPIANYEDDGGAVGLFLYDTREEAITSWNTRYKKK